MVQRFSRTYLERPEVAARVECRFYRQKQPGSVLPSMDTLLLAGLEQACKLSPLKRGIGEMNDITEHSANLHSTSRHRSSPSHLLKNKRAGVQLRPNNEKFICTK